MPLTNPIASPPFLISLCPVSHADKLTIDVLERSTETKSDGLKTPLLDDERNMADAIGLLVSKIPCAAIWIIAAPPAAPITLLAAEFRSTRELCEEININLTGTRRPNDFATTDASSRADGSAFSGFGFFVTYISGSAAFIAPIDTSSDEPTDSACEPDTEP